MNAVEKRLGKARIELICSRNNLQADDIKIVLEIFEEWDNLTGQTEKKIRVVTKKILGNPNKDAIIKSLIDVSKVFSGISFN